MNPGRILSIVSKGKNVEISDALAIFIEYTATNSMLTTNKERAISLCLHIFDKLIL